MKVKFAAAFHHYPGDRDGDTAIFASEEHPDPEHPWDTRIDPIIGFGMAGIGNKRWPMFIAFSPPNTWYERADDDTPHERLARMTTTAAGHLFCYGCQRSFLWPIEGNPREMRCPSCGRRGVRASYINERSGEFSSLLGDLGPRLEAAIAGLDPATAPEFRFPDLMLAGDVPESPGVKPEIQDAAAAYGLRVALARDVGPDVLFGDGMDGDDASLLISPDVSAGVLDLDEARSGWLRSSGCLTEEVHLPWLPRCRHRPLSYGGARI